MRDAQSKRQEKYYIFWSTLNKTKLSALLLCCNSQQNTSYEVHTYSLITYCKKYMKQLHVLELQKTL